MLVHVKFPTQNDFDFRYPCHEKSKLSNHVIISKSKKKFLRNHAKLNGKKVNSCEDFFTDTRHYSF